MPCWSLCARRSRPGSPPIKRRRRHRPLRQGVRRTSVAIAALALPVIGMLERAGLKQRARTVIS
jgi:hypothetical protein